MVGCGISLKTETLDRPETKRKTTSQAPRSTTVGTSTVTDSTFVAPSVDTTNDASVPDRTVSKKFFNTHVTASYSRTAVGSNNEKKVLCFVVLQQKWRAANRRI